MEVFRSEFKVIEHFEGTRSMMGCPMLVFFNYQLLKTRFVLSFSAGFVS